MQPGITPNSTSQHYMSQASQFGLYCCALDGEEIPMTKLHRAPLLLVILALPLALMAAEFWTKKPYQNWSADETQRLLEESPWATTLTLSGATAVLTTDGASPRQTGNEMEATPSISYTLQFRSAQPIREAQIRSAQLNSHYDKMSVDQKASFDTNSSKFLTMTFPDRIVIAVTFKSGEGNYESLLRNYWASESLSKLSMTAFLNTPSERLSLTAYNVKDNTFQFTFPRPKQLPADGKIGVEFQSPRIGAVAQQRILQEFSLKKMIVNGEPAI
jgi:hypothetical protein